MCDGKTIGLMKMYTGRMLCGNHGMKVVVATGERSWQQQSGWLCAVHGM